MNTNFEYFNPNPLYKAPKPGHKQKAWKIGDCVIRAICGATGMTWVDAYKFASDSALKVYAPFTSSEGIEQVMKDLGFEKVSYPKGKKRETVIDFLKNHPNIIAILNLAGHCVCCKNGKFLDTWDCSYKTAYNYYVKK